MAFGEGLRQLLTSNLLKEVELKLNFEESGEEQIDIILKALAEALWTNSSLTRFRFDGEAMPRLSSLQALAEAMQGNTTLINLDVVGGRFWGLPHRMRLGDWATLIAAGGVWGVFHVIGTGYLEPAGIDAFDALVKACARNATAAGSMQDCRTEEQTAFKRRTRPPVKFEALEGLLQKESAVAELDLSHQRLCDDQAQAITRALRVNKTVIGVNLGENQIGDAGAQSLEGAIKLNKTVTKILLASNQIGDGGAWSLAESIKVNQTLTEINLRGNRVGEAGAQSLAAAIKVNKTVTDIDLGCNQIRDAGAQSLAEAIKVNKTLSKLDLSANQIADAGTQSLAEAIKVNEMLTQMFLGGNPTGDAGAQSLAEAMEVNKTLEIHLHIDQVSSFGAQALAAVSQRITLSFFCESDLSPTCGWLFE